jgi:excisionase family DNA binding protein
MRPSNDRTSLSTSEVASLLGLRRSLVQRWSEEGTLPSEKAEGGHRRVRLVDALSAGQARGLTTFLDPFLPWEANVWLAFHDAAHRGKFHRLINLALRWLSAGESELVGRLLLEIGRRPEIPFARFLDAGIRGFMKKVGEEWRGGRLQAGEEHKATQVVQETLMLLRRARGEISPPGNHQEDSPPVAVVGVMEGDQHDLGAQTIRVLLELEGWKVYSLGPNVPVRDFASIQQAQLASLVCISFSPTHTLTDMERSVKVLSEAFRVRYPYALALGGALFDDFEGEPPEGPFKDVSVSRSSGEFLPWVQALREDT